MTKDELSEVLQFVLSGCPGWSLSQIIYLTGDGEECDDFVVKHERGDSLVVRVNRQWKLSKKLRLVQDVCTADLPFPWWKQGNPAPRFVLDLSDEHERTGLPTQQVIDSFSVGMSLVVVAIDVDAGTVTLQPHGPWEKSK